MSNIEIEKIVREISLIPIEIVRRDQKPESINETTFNVNVNLQPTDRIHWVLIIRREGGEA